MKAACERAATKCQVFSTGEGYLVLRVQNGRHAVDAYLGVDASRAIAQAIFQTAQKELFAALSKKGSHVGEL